MSLKIDQEVCFLSYGNIQTGKIVGLRNFESLILIECNGEQVFAHRDFVVDINKKFCVVQSDNLAYTNDSIVRLDFTSYRRRNKTWESWVSRDGWIREFFDPYELRDKATVYGLEI